MSESSTNVSSRRSNRISQLIIVSVGVLVFLLLFFADKSNLDNPSLADVSQDALPGAAREAMGKGLPPLAPDDTFNAWVGALKDANQEEKIALLDSIVVSLQERSRFAFASDYATQLIALDSTQQTLERAAMLSRQAMQLDFVQADSSLFRRYADRSIRQLEQALAFDEENEDLLIQLGLAYVTSRQAQNSMKGIMTLRKVLEINPDNAEASYHLGLFSMQTSQFDKARSRFEDVLRLDPNNRLAQFQLAASLIQLGETDQARSLLEEVIRQAKDPALKQQAQNLLGSIP